MFKACDIFLLSVIILWFLWKMIVSAILLLLEKRSFAVFHNWNRFWIEITSTLLPISLLITLKLRLLGVFFWRCFQLTFLLVFRSDVFDFDCRPNVMLHVMTLWLLNLHCYFDCPYWQKKHEISFHECGCYKNFPDAGF